MQCAENWWRMNHSWMMVVSNSYYFYISHLKAQSAVALAWVCMWWISRKKLPGRLYNSHRSAVFTGLRPSRKPRWVRLLPHRPLRLPLSQQGPQSRRRRSWAPTMRSKRTQQTTAKVRRTTLKSPALACYFLLSTSTARSSTVTSLSPLSLLLSPTLLLSFPSILTQAAVLVEPLKWHAW